MLLGYRAGGFPAGTQRADHGLTPAFGWKSEQQACVSPGRFN